MSNDTDPADAVLAHIAAVLEEIESDREALAEQRAAIAKLRAGEISLCIALSM